MYVGHTAMKFIDLFHLKPASDIINVRVQLQQFHVFTTRQLRTIITSDCTIIYNYLKATRTRISSKFNCDVSNWSKDIVLK